MCFYFIHNDIHSPKLEYDGAEPKTILYKVRDEKGGIICRVDLWKDASSSWRKWFSEGEFSRLCDFLGFPKARLIDEWEIVSHVENGPIFLTKCLAKERELFVYYTLFEKQPSRYQCYIFAVFQRSKLEDAFI